MGFFDFLKKSAEPAAPAAPAFPVTLAADAKGTVVAMENIPDEVFAQGILGKCCGIDPTEGKIYAPADGEITQAPDSGHALGILTTAGVEVLIHVGVDTVEMKGDGFSPKVKEGDKVKKGDLLLEMDLDKIAAGAPPAALPPAAAAARAGSKNSSTRLSRSPSSTCQFFRYNVRCANKAPMATNITPKNRPLRVVENTCRYA